MVPRRPGRGRGARELTGQACRRAAPRLSGTSLAGGGVRAPEDAFREGGGYGPGMTESEKADALLDRIRRARDWAAAEEAKLKAVGEQVGSADDLAYAVNYVAYGAVREVLDEILQPGVHASGE